MRVQRKRHAGTTRSVTAHAAVYLYERSSGARPPWPRKVSECLEGRTRERDQPRDRSD